MTLLEHVEFLMKFDAKFKIVSEEHILMIKDENNETVAFIDIREKQDGIPNCIINTFHESFEKELELFLQWSK